VKVSIAGLRVTKRTLTLLKEGGPCGRKDASWSQVSEFISARVEGWGEERVQNWAVKHCRGESSFVVDGLRGGKENEIIVTKWLRSRFGLEWGGGEKTFQPEEARIW